MFISGKNYDVAISIESDQIVFMLELRYRMEKEYGSTPKFVFSNSRMTQETRIANLITDCFSEIFKEKGDEVRFNANSVRKFWEKRVSQMQLEPNQREAHFAQTAHSEATASKHYRSKSGLLHFVCIIREDYLKRNSL